MVPYKVLLCLALLSSISFAGAQEPTSPDSPESPETTDGSPTSPEPTPSTPETPSYTPVADAKHQEDNAFNTGYEAMIGNDTESYNATYTASDDDSGMSSAAVGMLVVILILVAVITV